MDNKSDAYHSKEPHYGEVLTKTKATEDENIHQKKKPQLLEKKLNFLKKPIISGYKNSMQKDHTKRSIYQAP